MKHSRLMENLGLIELQLNEVFALLLDGDPQELGASSARLQMLSADLKKAVEGHLGDSDFPKEVAMRIRQLGGRLGALREAHLRRQAHVQRGLQILVPAPVPDTYARQGRYGTAAAHTGHLHRLTA